MTKDNIQDLKPTVFLDCDGTVIVDCHFLDDPARVELLPHAAEGIRLLNNANIPVIIVSNQSGVARGYFDIETVEAIHERLKNILDKHDARVDRIYFCPHHPEGEVEEYRVDCTCRKPKPGMAETAVKELGLSLERSFVIGDKRSDIEFARNIGAEAILVRTGKGYQTEREIPNDEKITVFDNLRDAAGYIVKKINV